MNRAKLFLFTVLLLLASLQGFSQWTQLGQPSGGTASCMERVGNEIWAGYDYGIYTSLNEGATWNKHPTLNESTLAIKAKGDSVIAFIMHNATATSRNLSSITSFDGGVTWNNPIMLEPAPYYSGGSNDLIVTDSSLIYFTNNSNYFISYDFGLTWVLLNLPAGYRNIAAYSNKYLIDVSTYPIPTTYISYDYGNSWTFFDSTHVSNFALVVDSTFYFTAAKFDTSWSFYLARTSDFGVTWDSLPVNLNGNMGQLSKFNGKIYYYYYPYPQPPVVYESADGGDTWQLSNLPIDLIWVDDNRSILLSNWEYLTFSGSGNITRYNPATGIYYRTETGIKANSASFIKENNGRLFINAGGKSYMSSNAGSTFSPLPPIVSGLGAGSFNGDTILVQNINPYANYQKLCFSFDNGTTWDTILPDSTTHWEEAMSIVMINGKLYANYMDYVGVSSDFGHTWDSISILYDTIMCDPFLLFNQPHIEAMTVWNNELFIVDHNNRVIAKLDTLTMSWKVKKCVDLVGVTTIYFNALLDRLSYSSSTEFFVASDSGNTWTSPPCTGFPLPYKPKSISAINGIWYAPGIGGIFYSSNYGNTWQQLPTDNYFVPHYSTSPVFATLNGELYVAANNIWKSTGSVQTISGNVYFDSNNNGIKDASENSLPYALLCTNPNNIAFNADSAGNYSFLTTTVGDTLRASAPTGFCTINPPYYITNGNASNINFGIYFTPGIQDHSVDINNRNAFRPGFNTKVDITASNNGTVTMPTQLQVVLDTNLIYINSTVAPSSISGDTLTFSLSALQTLQQQLITIETELSFITSIGTPIECSATVFPVTGDTIPSNNYSILNTTVVGSFDPNDKSCLYGQYFTPSQVQNGDEMIYTVRFQNNGNFQADNIRITDTLSSFFDLKSFRVVSSSHTMRYTIEGAGIINFYFDNILLPPSGTDEPGSHGYVKYAVKCFPSLALGDAIDNTAHIYFDFNAPIKTNTTTTLIADPPANLGVTEIKKFEGLTVYPNPANSIINLKLNETSTGINKIFIYDQAGRIYKSENFVGNLYTTGVADFPNGIFTGKLITSNGRQLFFRFVTLHN